ncbi:PQQ-dependent sugar dehydrogenase [Paraglaciecola arctica]|uniref:PQQ-dependent sugar dehydrogenase n=1 Tax=Paraglaciecola arctica TaxID=1128911 RepID=UPI001C072CE6|nr:PQQ-dependent sugar dehydrogenase [Paraglaciecola arctica]MBU3003963.1 PQQ-dependent sugar dehydrogenase [Paraglaciecola arctica]
MQYRGFIFAMTLFFVATSNGLATPKLQFPNYQIQQIANDLNFPWSLAFMPDQSVLVTERSGKLSRIREGHSPELINGLPNNIYVQGQGGLLDVVLHPNFASNNWLYLSYSMGEPSKNALQVMRAKLRGNQLTEQQVVLRVSPYKSTPVHFAGRMTFLPDHTLLITSGDGFDYREDAQKLNSLMGKVIRIHDDGSVPANNPYVVEDTDSLMNYIFSYGHRNAQAIVFDPVRQVIFSNEHGPDGGDELNIIQAGVNYGWPVITHGKDYIGGRISPFTEYPNMQQPFIDWTPSIAPSGMAVHGGEQFKSLNGDLLISVLKFKEVRWVQMDGLKVTGQLSLFKELDQRIRDVRVHPDGSIYILTDSAQGKVLRVVPD